MEKLTFGEYRRYCAGKKIVRVAYDTENNAEIRGAARPDMSDPMGASLSFERIAFTSIKPGLNRVGLVSSAGSIWFDCVEWVALKKYHSWDVVEVYCKHGDGERAYCLLVDY